MKNNEWVEVISSNINKIKHNEDTNTLYVEFYTQDIYKYSPVKKEQFLELIAADSVGKAFQAIKKNPGIQDEKIS